MALFTAFADTINEAIDAVFVFIAVLAREIGAPGARLSGETGAVDVFCAHLACEGTEIASWSTIRTLIVIQASITWEDCFLENQNEGQLEDENESFVIGDHFKWCLSRLGAVWQLRGGTGFPFFMDFVIIKSKSNFNWFYSSMLGFFYLLQKLKTRKSSLKLLRCNQPHSLDHFLPKT